MATMIETASGFRHQYDDWPDYENQALSVGWRGSQKLSEHLRPHLRNYKKMLDVGCGPGTLGFEFQRFRWQGVLIGVDISLQQLKKAVKKPVYTAFALVNSYNLSFPSNSFDIVVSSGMVGLTGPKSVHEMYRVLKKGGYLAVVAVDILHCRRCSMRFRNAISCLSKLPNKKILLKKDLGTGYTNRKIEGCCILYIIQKL